jgi:hypothetical protein
MTSTHLHDCCSASVQGTMNELAQRSKKATDVALKAAQQQSTAMQFLQHQQQQLSALQQQLYGGGSSPWNFGVAYRCVCVCVSVCTRVFVAVGDCV